MRGDNRLLSRGHNAKGLGFIHVNRVREVPVPLVSRFDPKNFLLPGIFLYARLHLEFTTPCYFTPRHRAGW